MTSAILPGIFFLVASLPLGAQNTPAAVASELESLANRSFDLFQAGRAADGMRLLEQARQLAESRLGPEHPLTAMALEALGGAYFSQGQLDRAEPLFRRALAIQEKVLGPNDPGTAMSLLAMAALYDSQGAYQKSLALYQRALAIQEKSLAPDDPNTATILANMATLYDELGAYDKALSLNQRALAIREKKLGPEAPETARSLNNLAVVYQEQGAFDKALPLFQRALAIREKVLGPGNPDIANSLDNLGSLYRSQAQYQKALPLHQRALAVRERTLGPEHPDTAKSLNQLALLYQEQGNDNQALPLFQRALAIRERTLKPDHLDLAISLNNLAFSFQKQGMYDKALPLYQRALSIRESVQGPDHADTAVTLNNLGYVYQVQGAYEKALPLHQRALAIREKALGPDHPDTATSLHNLAFVYGRQGAYEKALPLAIRALAIYEKTRGPGHPDTAAALDGLANLYDSQEVYEKSLPLHRRSLAISEKVRGPGHPDTAVALNNLAAWYAYNGAYEKALPLARRALAIYEQVRGPDDFETANALNGLAELYQQRGAYQDALPLFRRAIAISDKTRGPSHPLTANFVNNLAGSYTAQKAYAEALPLYERARAIYESIGPESAATAMALKNLARLYYLQGDYDQSLPLIQRSLSIYTKALGPLHPDVRRANRDLHSLLLAQASAGTAACQEFQSFMAQDRTTLARSLASGVELRIRGAVADAQGEFEELSACMSAHPDAVSLGAQTVLDTKMRPLEAFRNALAALTQRSDPALKKLFEAYFATNRLLARTQAAAEQQPGEKARGETARLAEEEETERQEILAKSPEFRDVVHDVELAELRNALHPKQALVEFVRYVKASFPSHGSAPVETAHYGAFTIAPLGLVWTDLGPASDMDDLVQKLLPALRESENGQRARGVRLDAAGPAPGQRETLRIGGELYRRMMAPLEQGLADTREVFVSGDGMLRLVPLAALVDGNGRYLIESERLYHQIGAGRDLILWNEAGSSSNRPQIVANPDFGEPASRGPLRFAALPGASAEAQGILEQFPAADQIAVNAATPEKILALVSPRFLHLATHAFYEPAPDSMAEGDPSLRTGIALVGANRGPEGILRANEVAGMNLRGTSLVVVSACETGLGEVSYADGVSGLQRSLTLAGARTQMLALWKVDDRKTSELMIGFYRNLKNGGTKAEALRQAQLTMLKNGDPPAFWAAFVSFGDPGKL